MTAAPLALPKITKVGDTLSFTDENRFDIEPSLSHTALTDSGRVFMPDRVVVRAYGETPATLTGLSIQTLGAFLAHDGRSSTIWHCNDPHFPFTKESALIPAWTMELIARCGLDRLVPAGQFEPGGAPAVELTRDDRLRQAALHRRIELEPSPEHQIEDRSMKRLFSPHLILASYTGDTPEVLAGPSVSCIGYAGAPRGTLSRRELPNTDLPRWIRDVVKAAEGAA